MTERKAIFLITILKNITTSYFDTFFVLYFFEVANYDIKRKYNNKNTEWKRFFKLVKTNKNVRHGLLGPLLSRFTYASGVMGIVITLSKIYNFKTSLNLGNYDELKKI